MILQKIGSAYKYTFYKLYRWSQAVNGENGLHGISAIIMLSFSLMLNLFTLEAIVQLITGFSFVAFIMSTGLPDAYIAVFAISMMLFNLYFIKHRIGYETIIEEFGSEDKIHEKRGNIAVVFYVIGSLVMLFVSWFGIYLRKEIFNL